MSNCGCNPQGGSPPNTFVGTVSVAPGAGSPFGGMTHVARGPCRPFCPSPPVSTAQVRAPYVPPWLATLTNNPFGRMIVAYGGALYGFQSKCNGPVWYDASTGSVSVQNPPYASAIPKETDYGYVLLGVPSAETICRDGQTDCETEIRQQFAAQRVNTTDCGDILLWNAPACGQVPPLQASDAANQGRFDRATLKLLDDIDGACIADGDLTLFGFYPKTVQLPNGGTTTCRQPVRLRRLRWKANQWGTFASNAAGNTDARIMIAKRVGGTDDNPCMELEMTNITLAQLNTIVNNPEPLWNWQDSPEFTIYNGPPDGLPSLGTFNFGIAPTTAKNLKFFINTTLESSDGSNASFFLVANGQICAIDSKIQGGDTSYQEQQGFQAECPALSGGGGNISFAGSNGGPPGGNRNVVVKITLQAWSRL